MIKATLRPSLSIKSEWVDVPRPRLRLINEPMSRWGSSITTSRRKRLDERKVKQDAFESKSPERSFPIPSAAALAARGPDRGHDLLVAVAELVALEQRIGYTFTDKLLALSALKTSNAVIPVTVKSEALNVPLEDWKRLALVGDQVLYLALCQSWFESGRSRCKYRCQCYTFRVI